MLGSQVRRFCSCVALVSTAWAMMSLSASAQPTDYHYNTAMTQVYGSQYPITGRLDVQVFPDGTLRGYYHTSFYKLYIPVTGGRDADYIWLDIGPSSVDLGLGAGPQGRLHVVATVSGDGSIRGQVYPESAAVLSGLSAQYGFGSSPPESAGNQYLFTALPSTTVDPTPSP